MNKEKELNEEIKINDAAPQVEPETKLEVPWKGLIFIGVIILLMVACIIVIACLGGF